MMELLTPRLRIVEMTQADVPLIHALHSFPEVEKYNTIGIPDHPDQTKAVLSIIFDDLDKTPRTHYGWVIRTRKDDAFIGELGMHLSVAKYARAEIYYNLVPESWGQGYATEAVKELIRFAFEDLGQHRVEAGVETGNAASIRLLEKVGMSREGHHRKILPIRGEWKDNYHYAILEDDPRP